MKLDKDGRCPFRYKDMCSVDCKYLRGLTGRMDVACDFTQETLLEKSVLREAVRLPAIKGRQLMEQYSPRPVVGSVDVGALIQEVFE